MSSPNNGEEVLLKLRGRSRCTDGKGKTFMGEWQERTVSATYWEKPFPSECGHFHGNFGLSDDDCQHREVELIEWVGFSGGGKIDG
jgi:hypothetical protein